VTLTKLLGGPKIQNMYSDRNKAQYARSQPAVLVHTTAISTTRGPVILDDRPTASWPYEPHFLVQPIAAHVEVAGRGLATGPGILAAKRVVNVLVSKQPDVLLQSSCHL